LNSDAPQSNEITSNDEALFRLMAESVRDYAIFTTDSMGQVTSWNAGAQALLGYKDSEIIGRDAAILFTPEDRERGEPVSELEKAARDGQAEDERWHVRKDGSLFRASGTVTPFKDMADGWSGFVKVARDATERKEAEEALKASEQRFQMFMENLPGLAWIKDSGGRYVHSQ